MTTTALRRLQEIARAIEAHVPPSAPAEAVRIAEALIFAAPAPVTDEELSASLPAGSDIAAIVAEISRLYAMRGIHLTRVAGGWAFRTAPDLAYALAKDAAPPQKLSRAAMEVLAIIAYHQPATRGDIEDIRGVVTSRGTLDTLLQTGWVRLRGRRRAPGRPVTFGTTPAFLEQFGLEAIGDLPGLDELKGLGFLEGHLPAGLAIPLPSDEGTLAPDEDPLEADLLSVTPFEPDEG